MYPHDDLQGNHKYQKQQLVEKGQWRMIKTEVSYNMQSVWKARPAPKNERSTIRRRSVLHPCNLCVNFKVKKFIFKDAKNWLCVIMLNALFYQTLHLYSAVSHGRSTWLPCHLIGTDKVQLVAELELLQIAMITLWCLCWQRCTRLLQTFLNL